MPDSEVISTIVRSAFWAIVLAAVAKRRRLRDTANALRRLPQTQREHFLAEHVDERFRGILEEELRDDQALPDAAGVACFIFAPGTQRAAGAKAQRAGLVAAGSLGTILVSGAASPPLTWGCTIVAVSATIVCLFRLRRLRRMETHIEVSAFNLTEVSENGARRRVLSWRQPLELRNRRWHKFVEIGPSGLSQSIRLDHQLLEFDRAMQLVLDYGGFRIDSPRSTRATTPPTSA